MQKTGDLQGRRTNKLYLWILIVLCTSCSLLVGPQRASERNSDLPPPAGLKAEGLPSVPVGLVEKAGRYTSSRTATLQSWHPTRKEMLITTRFGETNQVHKVVAPGGDRSQLTFFSDPVKSASFHPVDGKYVILLKDENGDERHQFYRLDLDSNEIFKLTSDREPVVSPVWSHSGEWLLYTSGKRTEKTMDVYLMNPLDPKAELRVAEIDAAYIEILDVSPDDEKAIAYQYISAEETILWLIDIKTGSIERITPSAKDKVAYWNAAFSRDAKGIFLTSDAKGEFSKS